MSDRSRSVLSESVSSSEAVLTGPTPMTDLLLGGVDVDRNL